MLTHVSILHKELSLTCHLGMLPSTSLVEGLLWPSLPLCKTCCSKGTREGDTVTYLCLLTPWWPAQPQQQTPAWLLPGLLARKTCHWPARGVSALESVPRPCSGCRCSQGGLL